MRNERMNIDGHKCAISGSQEDLQVHHITYDRCFGEEDPKNDLITLCRSCHEQIHEHKDKFNEEMRKTSSEMVRSICNSNEFKSAIAKFNIQQQKLIGDAVLDMLQNMSMKNKTNTIIAMIKKTLSPKKATDILGKSVYEHMAPNVYVRIKRGKKKLGGVNSMKDLIALIEKKPVHVNEPQCGWDTTYHPGFFFSSVSDQKE